MEKDVAELVSRLSLEVVKDVAPDEIDLFEDIKEEFFKNPDAFFEKNPEKKEKTLGFIGGEVAEQFITIGILPVVLDIVKYIGSAGIDAVKKEAAKRVTKEIEEKFDKKKVKSVPNEKIMELREQAINNAKIAGLDDTKAAMIVESTIGKMYLMGLL